MLKNVTNQTRCKLFMGSIEIGRTNTAKFLGIMIDSNLTWKSHIDNVTKKVAKSVGIIKRVRHCLPVDTLNTLYNTLILPYINYCNIIWAGNKLTKINKYSEQQQQSTRLHALFVLQKKIVRIITLSPYNSHALPFFKRLDQLTIYDINTLAVATFMYRFENNSLPQVFSGFFVATSLYTSDLVELVRSFGLLAHAYADDLQVYCHMNVGSEQIMLQRFRDCADSVSRWMSSNRLKLNPSKTELIWFYSGRRQLSFVENDIELFGNRIAPVHTVRQLET